MAEFQVSRRSALPPTEVWARLTSWERHAEHIPFTTITVADGDDSAGAGLGTTFVARTGVGPLGFDDPMEVTRWHPPSGYDAGHCRVEKHGAVVVGWMELTVTPDGGGSVVEWREDAGLRVGGRLLAGPSRAAGRFVFGRLVDALLASP